MLRPTVGRSLLLLVVSQLSVIVIRASTVASERSDVPTTQVRYMVHGGATDPGTPFDHYWSKSVGSGHMALAQRQDYRNHLTQCQNDLGFRYVRGHGLLDDDMSVSFGPHVNSYYNVDSFIDFLLSINMRPIVELSFMPGWLASGNATVCHYKGNITPPTSYDAWHDVIKELASHLIERYGDVAKEFYFECWNEPGSANTFWTGTQTDYFQLYNATATAIKSVDHELRVGGPATDFCTCWVTDFIDYCEKNHVPYDFISTHCYSGGSSNVGSVSSVVTGLRQARQLMGVNTTFLVTEWSSSYVQGSGKGPTAGDYHDKVDQAAFLLAAVDKAYGLPDLFSYWAFSDVFEEPGFATANLSFHGGFGLLNLYQVPKPTYRAFELLHQTGNRRLNVSLLATPGMGPATACAEELPLRTTGVALIGELDGLPTLADCRQLCYEESLCRAFHYHDVNSSSHCELYSNIGHSTSGRRIQGGQCHRSRDDLCSANTGILAVKNVTANHELIRGDDGQAYPLQVLIYNHAAVGADIIDCNVTFIVPDAQLNLNKATVRRIDQEHSNPLQAWIDMGMPQYPNQTEIAHMLAASQLVATPFHEPYSGVYVDASGSITVHVPAHGSVGLTIPFKDDVSKER